MIIPPAILALIRQQRDALQGLEAGRVAKLVAIANDLRAEMERQLRRVAPGKFTAQQTRVVLARIRTIVEIVGAEMGQRIGTEIEQAGRVAAAIGRDGLIEQLAVWERDFGMPAPDRTRLAADLLDPGLVEYYEEARKSYGAEFVTKMRTALVRGMLANETASQTSERLADALDISEARAETIVRTEQSFAKHRRELLDAKALDLGLAKQLVTTFDDRTGADSKFVDGQVRALGKPFQDNEGRSYQHPPNRPNDREVMILVPEDLQKRYQELGTDPATSRFRDREAAVALGVERAGLLEGLVRAPRPGRADFIDASGQEWDVKGFNSHVRNKGRYNRRKSLENMATEFGRGHGVILDTAMMSESDIADLRQAISERALVDPRFERVVWFP